MKGNLRNVAGFLQRAFCLKKQDCGSVGRESYKFTITLNARQRFYLRKHTESGRVSATDVLVEKRYGIASGWSRGSYEFTVTVNARRNLPEKTQGIWGLVQRALFIEKHNDFSGLARVTCKFTVEMKLRRIFT